MILHKDTWGGLRHPGEQRTERAGAKRQTFHGYRTLLRGDGQAVCITVCSLCFAMLTEE